jgi:hypothetical protein
MKIKDLPKSDRPREKLIAKGVENLKDSELLAILLRTGKAGKNVIEIASQILSKNSKKRLLQMTIFLREDNYQFLKIDKDVPPSDLEEYDKDVAKWAEDYKQKMAEQRTK